METSAGFTELLARIRQGDEAALVTLVQKYEPKVRLAAHRLLGSFLRRRVDSVDVVQSVNCVLIRGLKEGTFELAQLDQLVALAVTLVRRKVAQHWRRLRYEEHALVGVGESPGSPSWRAASEQSQTDPAQTVQLQLDLEWLWQFMNDMERRLVQLRLQGCTTVEAALEMGIAANVLRVLLSRLRRRLRTYGVLADWL
jgi:RNA polymerase sigma factor (sigma-70 family)